MKIALFYFLFICQLNIFKFLSASDMLHIPLFAPCETTSCREHAAPPPSRKIICASFRRVVILSLFLLHTVIGSESGGGLVARFVYNIKFAVDAINVLHSRS